MKSKRVGARLLFQNSHWENDEFNHFPHMPALVTTVGRRQQFSMSAIRNLNRRVCGYGRWFDLGIAIVALTSDVSIRIIDMRVKAWKDGPSPGCLQNNMRDFMRLGFDVGRALTAITVFASLAAFGCNAAAQQRDVQNFLQALDGLAKAAQQGAADQPLGQTPQSLRARGLRPGALTTATSPAAPDAAQQSAGWSPRPPRECIALVNDSRDWMYGPQSIDELRQAVETNKRNFCSYLVIQEYYTEGTARSTSCIVPPQEAAQSDENAATMARRRFEDSCAAQITTADIMERNQQIRERASAIEAKASATATRKRQQAEWSTEAKNFELKGLTLALTKESLMAMTPSRSFFSCKPNRSVQLVETCIAVLESKTCIPQVFDTPKGPMQRMECQTMPASPSSLPAGVQALATFAGRAVVEVQVSFFQNKTLNVTLFANLDNAPAEDALSSKYGAPRERRDGMTVWYGKGEQLALSRDRVQIQSPIIGAQHVAAAKALDDAKVQADGAKAKADKEKRRGDF